MSATSQNDAPEMAQRHARAAVSSSSPRGIVRAARRPLDFRARGPRPAGDLGDPELHPEAGEDLCYLSGDWRIFQRLDGHRWSLDDLATAHYAVCAMRDRPPLRRFVDLGCGIGSVLLMIAWAHPDAHGIGIEAQEISVALARRSLRYDGADGRLEVRCADFREHALVGGFDLVTGTPPYFAPGAVSESHLPQRGPCRIEHRGGIEDYCTTAARLLAPGAPFVVSAGGPDARARAIRAAGLAGLVVERLRAVVPRAGKDPLFWLFRMCRAGSFSPLVEEAPLVVRDERGARTPALVALRHTMGLPP